MPFMLDCYGTVHALNFSINIVQGNRWLLAASHQNISANQNVTNNFLWEKPEEWLPCLPHIHKVKHCNSKRWVSSEQNSFEMWSCV